MKRAAQAVQCSRSGVEHFGHLLLPLAWYVQAAGSEPKHRTRRRTALHVSRLASVKDATICCLADNTVLFQGVLSPVPSGSTSGPVFLTQRTGVQVLLPPRAETRERFYPRMPKVVMERSVSRLLCLYPSKTPFFLVASFFLFPPSLPRFSSF